MFFLLKRLLEYLRYANVWVYLLSIRNQRIKTETDQVNLIVTYGLDEAIVETLMSILLLLLSCLLSIQAVLHMLDEIPQCVDYCDECLRNQHQNNIDNILQYAISSRSRGIPLTTTAGFSDEHSRTKSLPELTACSVRSCSRHILEENIRNISAKCEVCGQENCIRCKQKAHQGDSADETNDSSEYAPKNNRQQCSQCGSLATRCNHMQ